MTFSLSSSLEAFFLSLPPRPQSKEALDEAVSDVLQATKESSSSDNRRAQWEFLLRSRIFELASREGAALDDPKTTYYDDLQELLDVVLTFTEQHACDQTLPFSVLQDLLETQTITSCSHIFSWIEARSERLTEGMIPQKGKALVLLRTLNDLLRRLSKTGNTTLFCGRILIFLSAVFPLGERSGVNLRGEYGPAWDPVTFDKDGEMKDAKDSMEVDQTVAKMDTDKESQVPERAEEEKRRDFFNTFWSLQQYFSRPPILAQSSNFNSFKSAVNSVMPAIKEATVKERAMMGSKASTGNLKRKRETTATADASQNYFFAKFLTSPELLDLEISDTVFRRQFLFQLLILLSHLLQFSKNEKIKWVTPRNRSLHMDFVLDSDDVKWAKDTMLKVYEEIRQTAPNGRGFAETVQTILDREKNWIKWKNDLCAPFDKAPLSDSLFERTESKRKKMSEDPPEWKHKLGSAALTEIWAMGYRDIYDLQTPFKAGDVKDFVRDIERENGRIAMRKQQILRQAQRAADAKTRAAAPTSDTPPTSSAQSGAPTAVPPPAALISTPVAEPAPSPSPQKQSAPSASPLHPSLPAKPLAVSDTRPATPAKAATSPTIQPTPVPTSVPVTISSVAAASEPTDPFIKKAEEAKQRISWLALRMARDEYLHHFGKIGGGDVLLLAKEIEAEKEALQKVDIKAPGTGPTSEHSSPAMTSSNSEVNNLNAKEVKQESENPEASSGDTEMRVEQPVSESVVKPEADPSAGAEMQVDC